MSGLRCWNNYPSKAMRDSNNYTDKIKARTLYGYMKGVAKTNGPLPKANGSGRYYGGLYMNPNTKCLVHADSYDLMLDVTKGQYYCQTDLSNIEYIFNGEMYQGSTLFSDYNNVDVCTVTGFDISFGAPYLWLYLVDPSYTGTTYLFYDNSNYYGWPLISYNYNSDVSTPGTYIYGLYKSAVEQYTPYLTTGTSGTIGVTSAGGDSNNSSVIITRTSNNTANAKIYDNTNTLYTTVHYTFPFNFISLNLSSKYNYALWPPPVFSFGSNDSIINFPGVVTDPNGEIFSSSCRQPNWLYRKYGSVDISFTYIDYIDYTYVAGGTIIEQPSKYALANTLKNQLTCFQYPKCLQF